MIAKGNRWKLLVFFIVAYAAGNLLVGSVLAQDADATEEVVVTETTDESADTGTEVTPALEISNLDTVWLLITAFLVFFMQAGFALVEAGFVGAKHVTNILMKNLFDLVIGSLAYWAIGFGLMFGAGNAFFGSQWFLLNDLPSAYSVGPVAVSGFAFFFFQFAFAATAATIASGAMGGRTEFSAYLIYSFIVTAFIYPLVGHWIWGGGWLSNLDTPFLDFAGSTVVHSTGGWIALMGVILLGPRQHRFGRDSIAMPGHSMTLATLGTFILWLGWFGFNPGSALTADGATISLVTVTTNLAAAAGALVATVLGWYFAGKPQLPWALNGALAGLVSITAPCAFVTPAEAVLIGALGGLIMYIGVNTLESFEIDDVVGAIPVHGMCGVWGTLSIGLFHMETGLFHGGGVDQLISQVIGIVGVAVFVLVASGIMFTVLRATVGLRVPAEAEAIGLDIYEHGQIAYPEFTNSPSEPVAADER